MTRLRRPARRHLPLLFLAAAISSAQAPAPSATFAVTGVRVFDGRQVIPVATVVVENGRIAAVGAGVVPPPGIPVVPGAGATLMPGMIDAHVHPRGTLERSLQFGVTTELDMWGPPEDAQALQEEQERTGAFGRADILSAGHGATVPGGYPIQFFPPGWNPTASTPEEAQRFVADRVREGSDFLKIFLEDWSWFGAELPILDRPTFRALTEAARARNLKSGVHVTELALARRAIEDGVDGLVHVPVDAAPDEAFLQLAAREEAFVVPTLSAIQAAVGVPGAGASVALDPHLGPYLTLEEKANLLAPFPPSTLGPPNFEIARRAARALHGAGVPVLAGTDAANPGTTYGASMHREMELLVQAGLSPLAALAAATSAPAQAFGLADRGRIAPGLRADLILVTGDPTADILATRAIRRIWKLGREVVRQRQDPLPGAAAAPAPRRVPLPGCFGQAPPAGSSG